MERTAVITGAGSGIGAATARALAAGGYHVVLTGRRLDRLEKLADELQETGARATAHQLDVTDEEATQRFAEGLTSCSVLVNNAGGAIGTEYVHRSDTQDWMTMFRSNVLGALNVSRALLPMLKTGNGGTIVFVTSTAGFTNYEGGGGYSAAKHGEHALAATLRLELCGDPVRVLEIAPGMVRTEEFALNRYRGDRAEADAVYAGVEAPLSAEDVAEAIRWTVGLPSHVNIDFLVMRPLAQAAQHKVHRTS